MPTQIIALGIFSRTRRVTIFRSPCFRAAQICLNVFDLSEGSEGIITFDMGLRGLATLLKTLNYIPDCS